jgi:hypothetical protein
MYPPIQALQETVSRKDLPPVCEYELEAESTAPHERGPSGDKSSPSVSERLTGIDLGKALCEANEA